MTPSHYQRLGEQARPFLLIRMKPFVHLHTHSDYSLLDGASRIPDLARLAAEDGQPALAITDHGNLYGSLDLVDACGEAGIKPIIGLETYLRVRPEDPPTGSAPKARYHLILLAYSPVGFSNLCRISSRAFLEGFDSKPCVDLSMLDEHSEGLIATTACVGGIVPQMLLAKDEGAARAWAGALSEVFGNGNFYVELQSHGIEDENSVFPALIELAKKLRLPLLGTNDSHYCRPEDVQMHEALLCVQTKATLSDPKRFRFEGEGYWLKSSEEMRTLFTSYPEACDNSLLVAERVETDLPFAEPTCPSFLPGGPEAENEKLRADVLEGARLRYGDNLPSVLVERIEYELGVIRSMGFAGYFLIVADIVSWAKSVGIGVGPGRGSAAGSVVAYCLGITELDPLTYDLVFERFLNPGRKQMPDIDLDIDDARRGEVVAYVTERYGLDRVCQIGTFGTIHARTGLKDAARVLGKSYALGEELSAAMPPSVAGRFASLNDCMGVGGASVGGAQLQSLVTSNPDAKEVVELAMQLEGLKRSAGMHAAGVVISSRPLMEVIPLQRRPGNTEGPPVAQYDLHGVERFGLVKLDFLGLRTLGVIERAVGLARSIGKCPSPGDFPLDDPATYALLQSGKTQGIFQLESEPMQALLVELKPERFADLMAVVALYRPGPMAANMHHDFASRKNGRSPVRYPHPDFAPILRDTYGLMIYQESMMRVAERFAGYSLADADNLRKACGKKDRDLIAKERSKFVEGCVSQGYSNTLATHIFDIIEPFADYAFNKSHAAAYGLLSYRSAYLRVHYPEAFWAAQIASVSGDLDASAHYITAAREAGVSLLGPEVNASGVDMGVRLTDEGPVVQFGLRAIKDVGEGLAEGIVRERDENGEYASLADLCKRLGLLVRKGSVSALVASGACDVFGGRAGLMRSVESLCRVGRDIARQKSKGMVSLFDDDCLLAMADEVTSAPVLTEDDPCDAVFDILKSEREMLGVYLSGHPLDRYARSMDEQRILDAGAVATADLSTDSSSILRVGGILWEVERKRGRRGSVTRGVLEGCRGRLRVLAFGDQGSRLCSHNGKAIVCEGRVERSEEKGAQLVVQKTHALEMLCAHEDVAEGQALVEPDVSAQAFETYESGFVEDRASGTRVPVAAGWEETWLQFADGISDAQLRRTAEMALDHPGSSDVFAIYDDKTFWLGPRFTVDPVAFEAALRAADLADHVSLISPGVHETARNEPRR